MRKLAGVVAIAGVASQPSPSPLVKCPGNGSLGPVLGGVDFVDLVDHYEQMGARKIPEKGSANFKLTLADETYSLEYEFRFKSQNNADKFAKNIDKYLPAGGAY